jgi:hypothetical protein
MRFLSTTGGLLDARITESAGIGDSPQIPDTAAIRAGDVESTGARPGRYQQLVFLR